MKDIENMEYPDETFEWFVNRIKKYFDYLEKNASKKHKSEWCKEFIAVLEFLGNYEVEDELKYKEARMAKIEKVENKKSIVRRLHWLLMITRAGSGIEDMMLEESENVVTILYEGGGSKKVDICGDSGIAIIKDVVGKL